MPIKSYGCLEKIKSINNVHFTRREIDILSCILHHRGSKKIAEFLSISPKTAEAHTRNIMLKLDCHGRESVIDFIEKSKELFLIKQHYTFLRTNSFFELQLKNISRSIGSSKPFCFIVKSSDNKEELSFLKKIKKHLKACSFKADIISQEMALDSLIKQEKDVHYICVLPSELLDKIGSKKLQKEFSSHKKSFICPPSQSVRLIQDKTLKESGIDFSDSNTYYRYFFELVNKVKPEINASTYLSSMEAYLLKEQGEVVEEERSKIDSSEKRESSPHKNTFLKSLHGFATRKNLALVSSALFLCCSLLIFAYAHYFRGDDINNSTGNDVYVRSDLPVPNQDLFLDRPDLLSQIDQKLKKDQQSIKAVALVGIGGAGKTTLARYYGRQQNEEIVWEVNAETKTALIDSFESLAYALSHTQKDKNDLIVIRSLGDEREQEKNLVCFVKEKLRSHKNWFLIYDNVGNFSDIQHYFPRDANAWGRGRVIVTTQDSNIKNNIYIGAQNTVGVSPLSNDEKLSLFTKILASNSFDARNKQSIAIKGFIKKLPPFPLDVSVAAYYLRSSGMSHQKYLHHLDQSHEHFFNVQRRFLADISDYTKTRYGIVSISLKKLLKEHPSFNELLLLVSSIDSQNIPVALLRKHTDEMVLESFLHHLKKYSLIEFNNTKNDSFSLHRSTQNINLSYLKKNLNLEKNSQYIDSISTTLEQYIIDITNEIDEMKLRSILKHVQQFRHNYQVLSDKSKGSLLIQLGRIYYYLGDYEKARDHLSQANSIYENLYSSDHQKFACLLTYIAKIHRNFGNHIKAEELLKRTLLIYKQHNSSDSLKFAWVVTHLGNIYRSLGRYQEAQDLLRKSLSIYKKRLGDENIKVAWTSVHLGDVYRCLGRYKEAFILTKESYPVFCKHFGKNHAATAWVYTCLGRMYQHLGRTKEARAILEKSLKVYKKYYGENHIQTAWVLRGIGRVCLLGGSLNDAENFLESSFKILQQKNNPDQFRSLELLADVHRRRAFVAFDRGYDQKYQFYKVKSLNLLKDVLAIVRTHFPENSPHITRLEAKLRKQSAHPTKFLTSRHFNNDDLYSFKLVDSVKK